MTMEEYEQYAIENGLVVWSKEMSERAIKALEQEPSGDLISRADAIEAIASRDITDGYEPVFSGRQVVALLNDLDSVNPQERTGHWIEVIDEINSFGNKTWHHKCSICGNENSGWGEYNYCPNCGCRMVEPKESEDKDGGV